MSYAYTRDRNLPIDPIIPARSWKQADLNSRNKPAMIKMLETNNIDFESSDRNDVMLASLKEFQMVKIKEYKAEQLRIRCQLKREEKKKRKSKRSTSAMRNKPDAICAPLSASDYNMTFCAPSQQQPQSQTPLGLAQP
eukprot:764181_1